MCRLIQEFWDRVIKLLIIALQIEIAPSIWLLALGYDPGAKLPSRFLCGETRHVGDQEGGAGGEAATGSRPTELAVRWGAGIGTTPVPGSEGVVGAVFSKLALTLERDDEHRGELAGLLPSL
ncbi:hypothetical protein NDU88_005105 [Pleurodeles waltl]|uniref:Uncharacterized protein n=1 Tax=Pleurodeles waltl TaxID=8319 RepID=A0AAV7MVC1_PLEWA|nr:hypothetical protein NDU88_005105 [Pleurodeles waltl]